MPESQLVVVETQVTVEKTPEKVAEQLVAEAAIKKTPESQLVEETQVFQQVVVSGEASNADGVAIGSRGSARKRIYLRNMTPNSKERELQSGIPSTNPRGYCHRPCKRKP